MTTLVDRPRTQAPPRARPGRAFAAMIARELHVMRRNMLAFVVNTAMQPLLAAFVFTYVLPKIGAVGRGVNGAGGQSLSSVIVPGMVANAAVFASMTVVCMSLVRELSFGRAIEDRMLSPMPLWALGLQKITWGAINGLISGLIVFPVVYFLHAPGLEPRIHVSSWPLFLLCLVCIPLLGASIGLLVGTILEVTQINVLINLVMVPATLLGCVYFPWAALRAIPWLQVAVLVNPVVYASEALRTVFTPEVPHMPVAVFLLVLVGGTALVGWAGMRSFRRRLLG
jgi:ABC-2 type transport system permease protein